MSIGGPHEVLPPHGLWLTDITEHPTREGKVYCAAVLDVDANRSAS